MIARHVLAFAVVLAACEEGRVQPPPVGGAADARAADAAMTSLDAGPDADAASSQEDAARPHEDAARPQEDDAARPHDDAAARPHDDAAIAGEDAATPPPDAGSAGALAFDVPYDWTALPPGYALTEDVTGDGRRDAVLIDAYNPVGQNRITFAVQGANGAFTPGSTFVTPGNPGVRLDYADFDGDGTRDVAIRIPTASSPNLYLALGDGAGGFGATARALTVSGDVFADFDGDGRADVLDPFGSGDAFLHLAQAGGTYRTTRVAVRGDLMAAGDFDGDGTIDLVAGTSVHRGLGGGAFGPALPATCAACGIAERLRVARVDADGRDDLVVGSGSAVTVLLAQPSGALVQASSHAVSGLVNVSTGDIDGDARLDLLVISQPIPVTSNDGLELLFGDGSGGFPERVVYQNTQGGSIAPIVTDASGDGRNDVLLGGRFIGENDGGRRIRAPVLSPYRVTSRGTQLVDFDGDRRLDLVTAAPNGALTVHPFGADRRLAAPTTCRSPAMTEYQAARDITGDGIVDIRAIASGALTVWVGSGACAFGPAQVTGSDIYGGTFVDLNGDRLLDLVHAPTGQLAVRLATGPGAFGAAITTPFTAFASTLVPADFTGDGVVDLVVVDDDDVVTVWRGDAGHRFTSIQTFPRSASPVWYAKAADVDGDGDADVVFSSGGALELLDNDGRGALTRRTLGMVDSVVEITVADLDADGTLEIVAADNQLTTSIYGVAPGGPAVRRLRLAMPRGAFPYDADGDGDLDLVYTDDYGASGLVAVANNRAR